MPKASPIQNSFNAGELSPRLLGRSDLDKYQNSSETLLNMEVMPHGPVTSRGGTQHIEATKTGTEKARLVPFEFSTAQAYVLEFGNLYIRVFANKSALQSGPFADEFADEFDTPAVLEIVTPYTEAELFELQFTQSADTLYIAHKNHAPMTLVRTTVTTWILAEFVTTFGPYLDLNIDDTLTITPSATTGNITLVASAALFLAGHVGALWRYGTGDGYVKITGFTSDTVVAATVIETLSGTSAISDWSEGAWSDANGYPRAVAFYEQRLWWAGSIEYSQTLWASQSADYPNHLAGSDDSDALKYTIASDQVNAIQWLSPGDLLAIGTAGGIHVASASSRDAAITPTDVRIVRRTKFGCLGIQPTRIADVVIFVQRGGEKVRQLEYSFESDSYNTPDLTLLSEHITRGGISQLAYQQDPDSIIWGVRADGRLVGMTYERDQDVFGWHSHVLGGTSDASGTQALVESVAVIPGSDNVARDEVWLSVKRWINGVEYRYIEVKTGGLEPDADIENAFFIDSGLSYDGAPATTISGLDHLEGEAVQILADGATHPDKTVVSGAITLDRTASKVHIGLYKNRDVGLLRIEAGSADGTAQGKIKRISSVAIRFFQSVGILFGPDATKLDRIPFRDSSDLMDQPIPPFTGDKKAPVPSGYDRDGKLYFRQPQPLPFTLLAVMPEVKTNG
jgi:hypothetical protein